MKPTAAKIHIGLITTDKNHEIALKESLDQAGGGYVHTSKSMLELYQKLGMQKLQLIVVISSESDFGQESLALIQFFRSKRETTKIPICVMTPKEQMNLKVLVLDPRMRCFPLSMGFFIPMMTMMPLAQSPDLDATVQPLATTWIQHEFEESAKSKLGQGLDFMVGPASDDDLRTAFVAQSSGEVRSHLGWFKFSVRILKQNQDSLHHVLGAGSADEHETIGQTLLEHVLFDFNEKVVKELQIRGAFFYPEMDQLAPADRKQLLGKSKGSGLLFQSQNISLVLEINQYI